MNENQTSFEFHAQVNHRIRRMIEREREENKKMSENTIL